MRDMQILGNSNAITRATTAFAVAPLKTWTAEVLESQSNITVDLLRHRFYTLGESLLDVSETEDGYVATGTTTAISVDTEGTLTMLPLDEDDTVSLDEAKLKDIAPSSMKLWIVTLDCASSEAAKLVKAFGLSTKVVAAMVTKSGVGVEIRGKDAKEVRNTLTSIAARAGTSLDEDTVSIEEKESKLSYALEDVFTQAARTMMLDVAREIERQLLVRYPKLKGKVEEFFSTSFSTKFPTELEKWLERENHLEDDAYWFEVGIYKVMKQPWVKQEVTQFVKGLKEATTSGMVGGFRSGGFKCPECETVCAEATGKCTNCDYDGSMKVMEAELDEGRKSEVLFDFEAVQLELAPGNKLDGPALSKLVKKYAVIGFKSTSIPAEGILVLFPDIARAGGFWSAVKNLEGVTAHDTFHVPVKVKVKPLKESEEDMNMTHDELVEAVEAASDFLTGAITESYHSGVAPLVKLFEAAQADEDYELALSIADTIAASLGISEEYEDALVEYKRQRASQRKATSRTKRRAKTGAQKRANRENKLALRHDPSKRRKLAKKAKKRNRIKKARGIK